MSFHLGKQMLFLFTNQPLIDNHYSLEGQAIYDLLEEQSIHHAVSRL
ncbi:MAG: hypothetical protein AAF939_11750 [Planctomycetota bacterium]